MTDTMPLLWAAVAGAMAAILLLRYAWSRPRRSVPLNGAAWAVLTIAIILSARAAGAWGVAMSGIGATLAAMLCLTHAALAARPGRASTASNRRANMLPQAGEPRHVARRIVTFLVTVPGAFLAVLLMALAARGLAGLLGWHEADSNTLPLFLVPLLWSVLATLLLIWPQRRTQLALLAVPSLASGLFLAASGGAA